jgi:hypothetical protein
MSTKNDNTPKVSTKRKASSETNVVTKIAKIEKEPTSTPAYTPDHAKQNIIDSLVTFLTFKYTERSGSTNSAAFTDRLLSVLEPAINNNNLWVIIEASVFILKTFEMNSKDTGFESVMRAIQSLPKTLSAMALHNMASAILEVFKTEA